MREIIDFHTHPYETIEECSCMYKDSFFLSSKEAKEDLQNAGITHICGSVIEPGRDCAKEGFAYIRRLNDKACKLEQDYQGYYTPGFHVHPDYVRESCEEIERMHKKGLRLIGELVPYMHGWSDYSNRNFAEILDVAEQYGMIISYHTVEKEAEQMERMISEHKKLIFVAAHPGQRAGYEQHIERMSRHENAWLDLSGTGLFRYGMLSYGVKKLGSERILFGTDYPICNPGMYVQAVLHEHITDKERENIFSGNAKRLFSARQKQPGRTKGRRDAVYYFIFDNRKKSR